MVTDCKSFFQMLKFFFKFLFGYVLVVSKCRSFSVCLILDISWKFPITFPIATLLPVKKLIGVSWSASHFPLCRSWMASYSSSLPVSWSPFFLLCLVLYQHVLLLWVVIRRFLFQSSFVLCVVLRNSAATVMFSLWSR